MPSDRMTVTCRMTPQVIDREVSKYWDGLHRMHTKEQASVNAR
jgi:hypothetical protein